MVTDISCGGTTTPTWGSTSTITWAYAPQTASTTYLNYWVGVDKGKENKEDGMRAIYTVYVVDPRKSGTVILQEQVIAEDSEKAKLKANVAGAVRKAGLDFDDVDIYCDDTTCSFIRAKKTTQRVKEVKEEDG